MTTVILTVNVSRSYNIYAARLECVQIKYFFFFGKHLEQWEFKIKRIGPNKSEKKKLTLQVDVNARKKIN